MPSKRSKIIQAMVKAIEQRSLGTVSPHPAISIHHTPELRSFFPRRTSFSEQTVRSRLCFSISALGGCPNQPSCIHAHSLDEFQPPTCRHGNSCNHITRDGHEIFNKDDENPCRFIHPSETLLSFIFRTTKDKHPFYTRLSKDGYLLRL